MEVTTILPGLSRDKPPPHQDMDAWEERLLTKADEIAEREGIPVDVAWSIASRHLKKEVEAQP